ncbi:hypothetical protein ACFW6M_21345 [Streptomyces nigra]|uniref:hypothetical protein n=1 Tax=Streptomyces nigra TaxID=1827580 RepID=UPI003698462D
MTESERERTFDRFWRAADSYHEATGLGLPIVRRPTRAGGGDVVLQAAPGGGLDAVVRLRPVVEQPTGTPRRAPSGQREEWVSVF